MMTSKKEKRFKFVDLFAGLGGFHQALSELDGECVFASEIDKNLRALYVKNFPAMRGRIFGDIRVAKKSIPKHDILCAGFPCQPFSKSGAQMGVRDETRGTLFHEIVEILKRRKPRYVLLENVGNFARHDNGRTWRIVREHLEELGYKVSGTEHVTPMSNFDWRDAGGSVKRKTSTEGISSTHSKSGGHGLISPHHFGFPHHRERFFIVATLGALPTPPFPTLNRKAKTNFSRIVQPASELSARERREVELSEQQRACINHWNALIQALPPDLDLPSCPIWGDELGARYPYKDRTPWAMSAGELSSILRLKPEKYSKKSALLDHLPSYARDQTSKFRNWKIQYIRKNREWWRKVAPYLPKGWAKTLKTFPPSLRKLEWNAKGGERDLWRYVLQFRPSGLRVKRYGSSPALVAMTATQVPILGRKGRFLTRIEGLRLQGFSDDLELPESRPRAFKALGNAVHVGVVKNIAEHLLAGALNSPLIKSSTSRLSKPE